MAPCTKCNATLTGGSSFCGRCRTPVPGTTQPRAQTVSASPGVSGSGLTSNVAGTFACVLGWITAIVFLVLEPYKRDRFVRFHAMQSNSVLHLCYCVQHRVEHPDRHRDQPQRRDCGGVDSYRLIDLARFFPILAFLDVSGLQPAGVSYSYNRRDRGQAGGMRICKDGFSCDACKRGA